MPFFTLERSDYAESLILKTAAQLLNSANCWNMGDFQGSDLTLVGLPNTFEHFVMDSDELRILLECYKTLYPREEVEQSSSVARKYSNNSLGTEKFGSKLDCRNTRSARIMASWTAEDGSIDISAPSRPGVVNSYVVHSVKLNGEFYQHVFAVIWWYKTDRDQDHFGKPTQVWKCYDYVHCGSALLCQYSA